MLNKFCALKFWWRWGIAMTISMLGCIVVFTLSMEMNPLGLYLISSVISVFFANHIVKKTSLKTTTVYIAHVTAEAIVIFDNKNDSEAIDTVLKKKPSFTRKNLYLIRAGRKVRECKESDFKG